MTAAQDGGPASAPGPSPLEAQLTQMRQRFQLLRRCLDLARRAESCSCADEAALLAHLKAEDAKGLLVLVKGWERA